jgi:hypothetical protein
MNQIGFGYGYDYYTPNNEYDEDFYIESIKPLKNEKVDTFQNEINTLVDNFQNDNEEEIKILKPTCDNNYNKYKQYIRIKNKEVNYYINHIYILYFVLLVMFIYTFFQNMAIKNLSSILKKILKQQQ